MERNNGNNHPPQNSSSTTYLTPRRLFYFVLNHINYFHHREITMGSDSLKLFINVKRFILMYYSLGHIIHAWYGIF